MQELAVRLAVQLAVQAAVQGVYLSESYRRTCLQDRPPAQDRVNSLQDAPQESAQASPGPSGLSKKRVATITVRRVIFAHWLPSIGRDG